MGPAALKLHIGDDGALTGGVSLQNLRFFRLGSFLVREGCRTGWMVLRFGDGRS